MTGAARGLGNLMARTFIESGSNTVAILDLSSEEAEKAANEATEWFEKHGGIKKGELDIIGIECNVADEESVQRAVDRVHRHYGRLDVVVNSAGIVENFPAEEYPTQKLQKVSPHLSSHWGLVITLTRGFDCSSWTSTSTAPTLSLEKQLRG